MHLTESTIPLAILSFFLWRLSNGELIPVVMFMSVFSAASVVNIGLGGGSLGIAISYILLAAAVLIQMGGRKKKEYRLNKPRRSTGFLISLFTAYAFTSVVVFPRIFRGVPFTNPKFGAQVPLEWDARFLPQLIYLASAISLYFVASYRTSPATLSKALNWFVGGSVLASCIAMYQYASLKLGTPFPTHLLHSNPTYVIFEAYELGGLPRMNSTFPEASSAAFSFASALSLSLWKMLSGSVTLRNFTVSLILLAGLLLTSSTTGYICLIFIALVSTVIYFRHWKGTSRELSGRVLIAVPALASLLIIFASPTARDAAIGVAHTVLLDKPQTFSYAERTQSNDDAYNTAASTHWLGAGWGVCRASSIIPTMLGNVGIPGLALFIVLTTEPFLPLLRRKGVTGNVHAAALFALATILLDLVVSGPSLTDPVIWLLITVASRASKQSRRLNYEPKSIDRAIFSSATGGGSLNETKQLSSQLAERK